MPTQRGRPSSWQSDPSFLFHLIILFFFRPLFVARPRLVWVGRMHDIEPRATPHRRFAEKGSAPLSQALPILFLRDRALCNSLFAVSGSGSCVALAFGRRLFVYLMRGKKPIFAEAGLGCVRCPIPPLQFLFGRPPSFHYASTTPPATASLSYIFTTLCTPSPYFVLRKTLYLFFALFFRALFPRDFFFPNESLGACTSSVRSGIFGGV